MGRLNVEFIEALHQLEREKGISKDILIFAIEAALISGYKRNFNSAQNVRVDINRKTGVVRVLARKEVVDDQNVLDDRLEISLDRAQKVSPALKIGDIVEIEITPAHFGRIAAQTAKQVVTQRIREAERSIIYQNFVERAEDIVTGIIQRADARHYYVDLGRIEALLPRNELLPGEKFNHGERVKAFITRVERATKGPQIFISRTHTGLLKRLLEIEVPEIAEGLVLIHSVAREAGYRSKVAVYSKQEGIDPVGACVGQNGARVRTIVRELRGEKIDIVRFSEDLGVWISNALSPAQVISVTTDVDNRMANVLVSDQQLSLAIGKEGQNARLAAKLTSWKIDIKSIAVPDIEPIIANENEVKEEAVLVTQECILVENEENAEKLDMNLVKEGEYGGS